MVYKSFLKIFLVVLIIGFLTFIAMQGINIGGFNIPSALDEHKGIRRGLDLTGGSIIVYEAEADTVTDDDMTTVVDMLRQRLDMLGYFEATCARQDEKRIRIEIPAIQDPEEAVKELGRTAELQFVDSEGNVVLSGKDVVDARARYERIKESGPSEYHVALEFSAEGTTKFAEATERIKGLPEGQNYIAIKFDEEIVSQPRVTETISSSGAVISGDFDAESAGHLASYISSGRLPFSLKDVELSSVGPTLGEKALETSLIAGGIGVLIVLLFMLLYYRLPGLMADIALISYIAIVAIIMAYFRVNLSLPGIAGIVLSIGMAVDANVIIFERLKDELRTGKTLRASIDAGFARAFTSIIDSNITTLIAAVVLWRFGTGPIKGFAVTLSIGIVVSMFTAIVITRFLLNQVVGLNIKNTKLYGA